MAKQLIKERFQELAGIHNIHEGNLDDLQKLNNNLSNALKAFKKKAEELKLGVNFGDVTQAVNKYTEDVFKANLKRTGGKIDETGFGKGSADGTEGFGDMLYKGMDEAYEKYGEETVNEILEMYSKFKS